MRAPLKKSEINEEVIRELQSQLNRLITKHGYDNLLHPEILAFSQLLDEYIALYIQQSNQN